MIKVEKCYEQRNTRETINTEKTKRDLWKF